MIGPHALDQRADQSSAEFGMRHGRVGKRRAKLCVDVSDPELLRNFREIGGPLDAATGLELGPGQAIAAPARSPVDRIRLHFKSDLAKDADRAEYPSCHQEC